MFYDHWEFTPLFVELLVIRDISPQLPIEDEATQAEWLAIHWIIMICGAWRSYVYDFRPGNLDEAERHFVCVSHNDQPARVIELMKLAICDAPRFSAAARDACNRRLSKLEVVDDDTEFFHDELQMCLKIIPEVTEFIGTLPSRIAKLEKVA